MSFDLSQVGFCTSRVSDGLISALGCREADSAVCVLTAGWRISSLRFMSRYSFDVLCVLFDTFVLLFLYFDLSVLDETVFIWSKHAVFVGHDQIGVVNVLGWYSKLYETPQVRDRPKTRGTLRPHLDIVGFSFAGSPENYKHTITACLILLSEGSLEYNFKGTLCNV